MRRTNARLAGTCRAGFTLMEVQVYVAVMAIVVVIICHMALLYHHLYDKTVLRAHHAVSVLAAIAQMRSCFDPELPDGGFRCTQGRLAAGSRTVLLDHVTQFTCKPDIRGGVHYGMSYSCLYAGVSYRWYSAALKEAFTCS